MSDYKVPDEIKRVPRLCMDCKWSEEQSSLRWHHRCFNPKVVQKDAWALSHNDGGQPYGADCSEQRAKRFGVCGQKGKLWEPRT